MRSTGNWRGVTPKRHRNQRLPGTSRERAPLTGESWNARKRICSPLMHRKRSDRLPLLVAKHPMAVGEAPLPAHVLHIRNFGSRPSLIRVRGDHRTVEFKNGNFAVSCR